MKPTSKRAWVALALGLWVLVCGSAAAQESVCARVKIEIKQEMTLERQAFDAEMRITNSLPLTALTEVNVDVKVTDELGAPVPITTDPNDLTAKFFLRQTSKVGIDNTSGTGQVAGNSTATINWLLIPAPGAAGNTPFGKRYLVGATLRYRFGTETHVMELNPDAITVKPLPSLTLDYFLTRDVIADDPFTTEIEAPEPYTLGVRVKNSGLAAAKELKINSAQPRIIENQQGLPITFQIVGSYVQDMPASNSLLINFGDIPSSSSKMGRWQMESNLAGTFVDFSATFTHSDELGGALTSLLQATNAHLLVRDVRVDLPGRDIVRDFLAADGTAYNVYESEGQDATVTDRSNEAMLAAAGGGYRLTMPATAGFFYVRKPDPYNGTKVLGQVLRADAKAIATENVWLSKTKDPDTHQWKHWFNVFDANSPGVYDMAFRDADTVPTAPVLQFIPDRVVKETEQLGFLVEASSPNHKPVMLSAEPLPTGATFHDQGDGTGVFDWTPAEGQAGNYVINYRASDGTLVGTRTAKIRVESDDPPPGPAVPIIVAPLPNAEVASLRPQFQVATSEISNDPTQSVQFELYADAGFTELVQEATVTENPAAGQPTVWTPDQDLNDNKHYYWRARALAAGGVSSTWVDGSFFANLFNDPPDIFNLTSPAAGIEVASLTPTLSFTNADDRDGDALSYSVEVFKDAAMTQRTAFVTGLAGDVGGITSWVVTLPLTNHATYYWRAVAIDEHGAETMTPLRTFTVNTGNVAPELILGNQSVSPTGVVYLTAEGIDADNDQMTFSFEVDAVNTFDSPARRTSGPIVGSGEMEWVVEGLAQNQQYYWRAKASDGRAESPWAIGDFFLAGPNTAPTVPVIGNPSNGAWVSVQYPTFAVHASTDADGDPLRYEYEIEWCDAQGAWSESGTRTSTSWNDVRLHTVSGELKGGVNYCWRVRAVDSKNAASAWSPVSRFVTTAQDQPAAPTIVMTAPTTTVDARDISGTQTLTWHGHDANAAPTVGLYYDTTGTGYAGTAIVTGLSRPLGHHDGSYPWSLSGLAPGAYFPYGVIHNQYGISRAYAPGVIVVPASPQLGNLLTSPVASPTSVALRYETMAGTSWTITVRLTRAPTRDVVIPVSSTDTSEITVNKTQLVFTSANWSVLQTISGSVINDGITDGDQPASIILGKPVSRDPHYIGIAALRFNYMVVDAPVPAGPNVTVSGYQLISKTNVGGLWHYRYKVILSNGGTELQGVRANVSSAPGFQVVKGEILFGAMQPNESQISTDYIELTNPVDIGTANPTVTWIFTKIEGDES